MAVQLRFDGTQRTVLGTLAMVTGLLLGAASGSSEAQVYPVQGKVIKLIVPFATGGSSDIIARLISVGMATTLGTPVIVENHAGADGSIGANLVATAPPDGYTLGVFSAMLVVPIPMLRPELTYAQKPTVPVSLVQTNDQILVSRLDLKANNIVEVVALARANPGTISFGHTGVGSANQLMAATVMYASKIQFNMIPYKGEQPPLNDVMAGRLDRAVASIAAVGPLIDTGRVKPIAALGLQRAKRYPNLPTVAEAGYTDFNGNSYVGVHAPGGTPVEILDKIAAAVANAVKDSSVRERIEGFGGNPVGSDRACYVEFVRRERARIGKTIKDSDIKYEN
jgi:tripartite-type tricarboxylate transporter receptor subunit TctC